MLTVILNVKIRSHQMINAKAGTSSQLHSAAGVAWLFVLVLSLEQCFSNENWTKTPSCMIQ